MAWLGQRNRAANREKLEELDMQNVADVLEGENAFG
jgi:hypothetical protein